jgi:alpha-tubulin suppressor-like RCC1 family protein
VAVNTDAGVSALSGKTVVAIVAGSSHSGALCADGTLATWGYNGNGQLGDYTTTARSVPVTVNRALGISALSSRTVTAIAAGGWHTLALCSDGTVTGWGANSDGELGDTSVWDRPAPVTVNTNAGVSALAGKHVVAIAGGQLHSVALCSDGTAAAWGYNYYGQLGNGTTTPSVIPVQVPGLSGVSQVSAGVFYSLAVHTIGFILR